MRTFVRGNAPTRPPLRSTPRSATRSTPQGAPARSHCCCAGTCPRCSSSAGQPLEAGVRRTLEASYHADLSGVRVHTGPAASNAAAHAGARALTLGSHIVFARDQYQPHTRAGFQLIAHEAAHVVQQRTPGPRDPAAYPRAEHEAGSAAARATRGGSTDIAQHTAGMVQHQGTDDAPPTFITNQPEFQLQLDPEIQAMALRYYLRWWVGSTLTGGEPSAPATPEPGTAPEETAPAPEEPASPPLPPEFFRPFNPGDLTGEPDVGAILAPYNLRNVPLGARDVDAATAIYQQNYRFVSMLPDLRAIAPAFIRPIIPGDWRTSIAEAFTAATLNAQLKHDYPTPIEAADLSFYRMTGVSTTYIPLPGFSF